MNIIKHCLALFIVIALAGCASQRVEWDYDRSATAVQNMEGWKNYGWIERKENKQFPYQLNGLLDQRVRAAVNNDLRARGYRLVNPSEADFLVNYLTTTKTRYEQSQVTSSFGYGMGFWGTGFQTESRMNEYEEGSLMIDVVDPKAHELMWRGTSKARVIEGLTPEQRVEKINGEVQAILANFPPKRLEEKSGK